MANINLELNEGSKQPYSIIVTPGTYAVAYWSVTAGSARLGDDFTVDRDRGIAVKVTENIPVKINFSIVDDRIAEEREFFNFHVEFEAFDVATGASVASLNDDYTIVIVDNDAVCFIDLNRDGLKSGVDLTYDQIHKNFAKAKQDIDNANVQMKIAAEKLENLQDQKYLIRQLVITEVLDTVLSASSLGISSFGKILGRDLPAFIDQLAAIIQPLPNTGQTPQPKDFAEGGPIIDAIKGLLGLASAFTKVAPIVGLTVDTYQRVRRLEEIADDASRVSSDIKEANAAIADLRTRIALANADVDKLASCLQKAARSEPENIQPQSALIPSDIGLFRSNNDIVVQTLGLKMTSGSAGADDITLVQGFFEVFPNRIVVAGAGNDTISVTPSLSSPMLLVVAGGEGFDTLRIEGNSADYQWHITQDGNVALTAFAGSTGRGDGWRILLDQVERLQFIEKTVEIVPQRLDGTSSSDRLVGRELGEKLFGGLGTDTLVGLRGADTLMGNVGNDVLIGDGPLSLTSAAQTVRRFYLATLDRDPDEAGWAGWTERREGGESLDSVAAGFVNSQEFQAKYGALDNAGFVTQLYRNVLDREPDVAGFLAYKGALESGQLARTSMVSGFVESAEFIWGTTPELHAGQVYRLYGATLARAPNAAGFEGWTERLSQGRSLIDVTAGFVNSLEFQQKYGSTDNMQFVTLLYQNVLGRAPDAAGLASWKNLLDTNAQTRTQVVTGFSESAEYIASTRAATDAFMRNAMTAWSDTLQGGQSDDKLTGGRGSDRYVFSKSEAGNDTIYGFEGFDTLELQGFGYQTQAQALAAMSQQGTNVVLTYEGGSITFEATQIATLQGLSTAGWVLS